MGDSSERVEQLSPLKRAILELRDMRARIDELEQAQHEPIAIVGMGLRFPGDAHDPDSLWQLLKNSVDAITEIPADRWDVDAFYSADRSVPGRMYTQYGGFLKGIDQFAPHFFGISPREAASMDPQQRLLMEVTWEALEHAGQAPDQLMGRPLGVFMGICNNDYMRMVATEPDEIDVYFATGNIFSVASGRLSYFLGAQGPSIAIDSACSSSLVTVHLACQSLRAGESDMAVAGGVNLILSPEMNINFSKANMMSEDGRCKTFDARADGYVRGEGCGVVVLKRLADAVANKDNILAVVRGSAVNQDGRSNGLTAPNGLAQEAVIRAALSNAQVNAAEVSYVEAHGTGTSLGDPIEVRALAAVYGQDRASDNALQIGSIKTNIGHLEGAAGVAGLIKSVLALQHREIPAHLHFQEPNPLIDWENIPLRVSVRPQTWTPVNGRYLAGISSFGFSGTNAHLIIEAAPSVPEQIESEKRPLHLLTLSAKEPKVLTKQIEQVANYLATTDEAFSDICYTANTGRAHLSHRFAVVATDAENAQQKMQAFLQQEMPESVFDHVNHEPDPPEIAFLFTGHGAQYVQMGRQLFETDSLFRATIEACETLLRPFLDVPLTAILYPEAGQPDLMAQMSYAQPALFAIEYALAQLWQSWGVRPTVVTGHSLGEYVAACVAGVFTLADGLKLVATRGRLMDALPESGEMAVVFAPEEQVAAAIALYVDKVSIAVINGATSVVISGNKTAVQAIVANLNAQDIKTKAVAVTVAAHSPLLDPILDEFAAIAEEITYHAPQVELISCTTGKRVVADEITNAAYWRRHLRHPVRFADAMATLHEAGYWLYVEIGSHPTMLAMGRRILADEETAVWLPSLHKEWPNWQQMLESLAGLYTHGGAINWEQFDDCQAQRRVTLPTTPWIRQRYWAARTASKTANLDAVRFWQSLVSAGRQQEEQAPLDLALPLMSANWQLIEQLSSAYIMHAFLELGAFTKANDSYSLQSLMETFGILPSFDSLLKRWLSRLVDNGLLQKEGEVFVCPAPLPPPDITTLVAQAQAAFFSEPLFMEYVERCGRALKIVLTGEESALSTLFPEGSYETADFLYHDWSLIRYFNGIMRSIVTTLVNEIPQQRKIRILEIGAGTGGTAATLLPLLPPERTEYHFTDMSNLFLARAEERFQEYPFVQYGLLNAELEPSSQGFDPQSFDIVVAANVLHATRNLDETLANVHQYLAPGGLLLLFETTNHLAWFDITTSLIEGWGLFEDDWREDDPLISVKTWHQVLKGADFEQIVAFPQAGSAAEVLGEHIILARTPVTASGMVAFGQVASSIQVEIVDFEKEAEFIEVDLGDEFRGQLLQALADEREEMLLAYVRQHVGKVLRIADFNSLDRRSRLMDLGVDSLMALELRNRLQSGLNLERKLPATLIFDYPTIDAVVHFLDELVVLSGEDGEDTAVSPADNTEVIESAIAPSDLQDMSDEEVEAMLLKKLENI